MGGWEAKGPARARERVGRRVRWRERHGQAKGRTEGEKEGEGLTRSREGGRDRLGDTTQRSLLAQLKFPKDIWFLEMQIPSQCIVDIGFKLRYRSSSTTEIPRW